MNREEIKQFIFDNFKDKLGSNSCFITIKFNFDHILNDIIRETNYLSKNFNERIYHIINNLYEIPQCKCGSLLNFISFHSGYRTTCRKCLSIKGIKFENNEKILCSHGCKKIANFKFIGGTYCCEIYPSKCESIIKKTKNKGNKNGMFGKISNRRYTLQKLKFTHPILFKYENIQEMIPGEFKVRCKNCKKWFIVSFSSLKTRAYVLEKGQNNHFLFCSKDCAESSGIYRLINSLDISMEFKKYQQMVYIKTNYFIRKYKNKILNIEKRSRNFPIDHKYSIREAFNNNVPIEIVSHWKNLEITTISKNSKKRTKCSISLNELKKEIEKCGDT